MARVEIKNTELAVDQYELMGVSPTNSYAKQLFDLEEVMMGLLAKIDAHWQSEAADKSALFDEFKRALKETERTAFWAERFGISLKGYVDKMTTTQNNG